MLQTASEFLQPCHAAPPPARSPCLHMVGALSVLPPCRPAGARLTHRGAQEAGPEEGTQGVPVGQAVKARTRRRQMQQRWQQSVRRRRRGRLGARPRNSSHPTLPPEPLCLQLLLNIFCGSLPLSGRPEGAPAACKDPRCKALASAAAARLAPPIAGVWVLLRSDRAPHCFLCASSAFSEPGRRGSERGLDAGSPSAASERVRRQPGSSQDAGLPQRLCGHRPECQVRRGRR